MKKTPLYLLILCMMVLTASLTGCKNAEDYSNIYNPKTDYQYMYYRQGYPVSITASDKGYYFLNGNYIYYMDKTSMKPVLLDNRPDIDALSKESNAYVNLGMSQGFLTYYNDKLYTLQFEVIFDKNQVWEKYKLIEMPEDGSKRKAILTFDFHPQSIVIHRGCIYYASVGFNKESQSSYQVMKYDLNSPFSEPEEIYHGNLEAGYIQDILAYGKNIYFLEMGKNMYRLMRYDIEKKTSEKLLPVDDNVNYSLNGIFDNRLFFSYFYGYPDDKRSWVKYSCDLEGNNIKELPIKRDFISNFYLSGKYIFARPVWFYLKLDQYKHIPHEMTVYNSQYEIVDKFDLSFLPIAHSLIAGDDNYMFVQYVDENEMHCIEYMDKKDIGSGKIAFKELIKTPRKQQSEIRGAR